MKPFLCPQKKFNRSLRISLNDFHCVISSSAQTERPAFIFQAKLWQIAAGQAQNRGTTMGQRYDTMANEGVTPNIITSLRLIITFLPWPRPAAKWWGGVFGSGWKSGLEKRAGKAGVADDGTLTATDKSMSNDCFFVSPWRWPPGGLEWVVDSD